MAKLHKIEMFILDVNDEYGSSTEEVINYLSANNDLCFKGFNCKSKTFKWDDDLKINFTDAKKEDYEAYFK